jgi:hypothetical protein
MAVGHSDELDPLDAARSALEQCQATLAGDQPKAGLLFSTYLANPDAMVATIRAVYPDVELVGGTTAGEMSSVLGYLEDSVTLALFASDEVDITAGLGLRVSADPEAAAHRAVEEARGKTHLTPRLCIVVPSTGGYDPAVLLKHLSRELGPDVTILGGASTPPTMHDDPGVAFQFHGDRAWHDSAPILLFSGPLVFSFGAEAGWRPVGRKGTVTRVSDGRLDEIDGQPALAFFERYLGAGGQPTAANPLAVFAGDTTDFYLRAPASFDAATGSIILAGAIGLNSVVQLTVAVTDEIFDGTQSAVSKAITSYPSGLKPDAALIFSCAIRKYVLGSRTGTEIEIARRELGGALPVCGFYSFGEIAPDSSGTSRFHNETIVAVVLGTE